MAKAFADIEAGGEAASLGHAEWLALLLEREASLRRDKRLSKRLQYAKLRQEACVEDIDYRTPRGLDRSLLTMLVEGRWIDDHANLLICGPPGVGKSWLASALGNKACRDNRSVLYQRVPPPSSTAWSITPTGSISTAKACGEPANPTERPEPVALWTCRYAWTTQERCPHAHSRRRRPSSRDSRLTPRPARCQKTDSQNASRHGRHQIGMVGEIISESWARSYRYTRARIIGIRSPAHSGTAR